MDGALWFAVTLDPAFLPAAGHGWLSVKGLFLGVILALFPWLWLAGIGLEERWGACWRRWGLVPLLTLLLVLGAEAAFRGYRAQDLFWQSVRARAGDAFFTREVSLFRLDVASKRAARARQPGVTVIGSSQMLHALSVVDLSARIGQPVHRRAVAGMFPMEMCAWQGFLQAEEGSTLLMMLSGLDLGARNSLMENAIRPMATPRGLGDLIGAADRRLLLAEWRRFTDLGVASIIDLWRSRDFFQWILQNPFVPYRSRATAEREVAVVREQRRAYARLGGEQDFVAYAEESLRRFLFRMSDRFDRIVIVEGQVNPQYDPERWQDLSARMLALIETFVAEGRVEFVPIEAQASKITPEMWGDMIHVNPAGREAYTEIFASALLERSGEPGQP